MWLQVNKETKKIEGYIESCLGTPIIKKDCELVEVESIPQDWEYCTFENNQFILNELYKKNKEEEKEMESIRTRRSIECFPFINRGSLWYEMLNETQKEELKEWYKAWLDAPSTKIIPGKPLWLE